MVFRLTSQMSRDGQGMVPSKVCSRCLKSYPAVAFIKSLHVREDGYGLVSDSPLCHRCEPPAEMPFVHDKAGRLAMRLSLHSENGEPIRVWDGKASRWRAMTEVGLRLMTGTNQLRLQPYENRSTGKDGKRYAAADPGRAGQLTLMGGE